MNSTNVTVEEFLYVREVIAEKLKEAGSSQKPTRLRQAEELLAAGCIDIPTVLSERSDGTVTYAAIEQ